MTEIVIHELVKNYKGVIIIDGRPFYYEPSGDHAILILLTKILRILEADK